MRIKVELSEKDITQIVREYVERKNFNRISDFSLRINKTYTGIYKENEEYSISGEFYLDTNSLDNISIKRDEYAE